MYIYLPLRRKYYSYSLLCGSSITRVNNTSGNAEEFVIHNTKKRRTKNSRTLNDTLNSETLKIPFGFSLGNLCDSASHSTCARRIDRILHSLNSRALTHTRTRTDSFILFCVFCVFVRELRERVLFFRRFWSWCFLQYSLHIVLDCGRGGE